MELRKINIDNIIYTIHLQFLQISTLFQGEINTVEKQEP